MCVWCLYGGEGLAKDRLPHDPNTSFVFPTCLKDTLVEHIDWEAAEYLPDVVKSQFSKRTIVPLRTTGDGNCLLNAVSRAIFGVEVYWELLRTLVVDELKANFEWYRESTEIEKDEWDKALVEATKSGIYLNFQHIFALSNVIRRPIILYASDNDIARYGTGEGGCAATFVPARFPPSACVAASPIYLSWGSGRKNHFVPIIGVEGQTFPSLPVFQVAFPSRVSQQEMLNYINQHEKPKEPPILERMRQEASDVTNEHYTSAEDAILGMFARSSSNRNNQMVTTSRSQKFKEDYDEDDEWDDLTSSGEKVTELVTTPDGHSLLLRRPVDSELRYVDGKLYYIKRRVLTESDDGLSSTLSKDEMLEYYDRIINIKYEDDEVIVGHRKGDSIYDTLNRAITENPQLAVHKDKIGAFLASNIPYQDTCPLQTRTLPQKQPILYTRLNNKPDPSADFELLIQKILEFNKVLQTEWSLYALNPPEEKSLREVVQQLIKYPYVPATSDKVSFKPEHYTTLGKLIRWRKEMLFPVLDLLRLIILYPAAAEYYSQNLEVLKLILALAGDNTNIKVIQILTMKFLSNMFANKTMAQIAVKHSMKIISAILPLASSQDKFVHSCLAATLFNYSTALCDTFASKRKPHLCQAISQVIRKGIAETEKLLLQSIGNLLWKDKYIKEVVAMNLLSVVISKMRKNNIPAEVKEVLDDINYLLSAAN